MDDDLDQQGVNATGDSGTEQIDWSQFDPNTAQPEANTQGQAPVVTDGDNPKWAPFLEAIPTPFHEPVKKHLKEWDQGVNQKFQEYTSQLKQYEPYKPLIEQQADPDRVMRAYQLADRLASDPVGFYNDLRTGLISRGQLADVQDVQQQAPANADPDDPANEDPYLQKIQELEARLQERDEAIAQWVQGQQQEQQIEHIKQQELKNIDDGLAAVETKIGSKLSGPLKAEIIQRAMFMGQQRNAPVTIEEAAQETFRLINAGRQLKAAPRGIPGGGSIPQTPVGDPAEMSKEQRYEAARAIRERFADS